ncbi:hypothetical protein COCCU_06470 [Corynebacterium occultum]|uniref:Uncharacterized protein n=2 Tax=Corynebacterium occultum TaxID=2675219 RepID=A0A6B8VNU9_9CORY|nr:hypothetical protein COCCU_06470 [Corynebacterium occultum]
MTSLGLSRDPLNTAGDQSGWISLLVAGLLVILIGLITLALSKPAKPGN